MPSINGSGPSVPDSSAAVEPEGSHGAARDGACRIAPGGVLAVAVLFGVLAVLSLIYAVLTARHQVHLWAGYFVIGEFAGSGPVAYLLYALLNAVCAAGLLVLNRFARWLAILLLVWGLVESVPAAANAVIDQRFLSVVLWGVAIIPRVVAFWYLVQSTVCEDFAQRRS